MFLPTLEINNDLLVSDIVKKDYRTAEVFRRYGIDYCCGGRLPVKAACELRGVNDVLIHQELEMATREIQLSGLLDVANWTVDFLSDYIVNIHHAYLRSAFPQAEDHVQRFAAGHRKKFPEIDHVQTILIKLGSYLLAHLQEEEEVIFPYIRQIAHAYDGGETYASLLVRTLRKPVEQLMNHEHQVVCNAIQQIRRLTNNYSFDGNSCVSHKVTYLKMKELDNNIAQHLYLENNILLPRVIAMEQQLLHRS